MPAPPVVEPLVLPLLPVPAVEPPRSPVPAVEPPVLAVPVVVLLMPAEPVPDESVLMLLASPVLLLPPVVVSPPLVEVSLLLPPQLPSSAAPRARAATAN